MIIFYKSRFVSCTTVELFAIPLGKIRNKCCVVMRVTVDKERSFRFYSSKSKFLKDEVMME